MHSVVDGRSEDSGALGMPSIMSDRFSLMHSFHVSVSVLRL